MKKVMNQRLEQARNKMIKVGKLGALVGRLNASVGKQGSLQAHNSSMTTFNSTQKGRLARAFEPRSDRSDSRLSGRASNRSTSAKNIKKNSTSGQQPGGKLGLRSKQSITDSEGGQNANFSNYRGSNDSIKLSSHSPNLQRRQTLRYMPSYAVKNEKRAGAGVLRDKVKALFRNNNNNGGGHFDESQQQLIHANTGNIPQQHYALKDLVTVGGLMDPTEKGSSSSSIEHYRQRANSMQNIQGPGEGGRPQEATNAAVAMSGEMLADGDGQIVAGMRRQSDDLMLVREDGIDDEMTADGIKDQITSEEQLTPLAERESDMDEMSNANSTKQTQGRLQKLSHN